MSFIGSGPQKTEGVGKLCCNSIWFLCGSLCSLKGKEDVFALSSRQAPLPGSDLPNYHPYKEAKRPLTRAGLSPLLVLQPAFLQCQSRNCIFLPLHAWSFCFLLSPSLSPTIPLLSFNLLRHQHICNEDLSWASYCQSVLSWHEKVTKKGDNCFFSGDWRLQPRSQIYVGSEIARKMEVIRTIANLQQTKLTVSGTTATNFNLDCTEWEPFSLIPIDTNHTG